MAQNQVVGIAVTAGGRQILEQIPFLTIHDPVDDLKQELGRLWQSYRTIVFCLPLEKVVRLIAPHLSENPPAVIAINATATHVISVLGESYLVPQIADLLHAQPIGADLTTTGIKPVDQWGVPWGWRLGTGDWQGINQDLHQGAKIVVWQETGSRLWQRALPSQHNLIFPDSPETEAQVFISHRLRRLGDRQVQWHPRVLWLGLVCEPHTPPGLIVQAIQTACQIHYLAELAIAGIATPDHNEHLGAIAHDRDWCYKADLLPTSDAEALALKAGGTDASLIAHSQVFHHSHQEGGVTIAIAIAPQEYIGQEGHLGIMADLQNLTLQQRQYLIKADVIMATSVPDQFSLGKIIETHINYPQAISLAQAGLRVVLVNDRADLVFSHLLDRGWNGHHPLVEVIPAVSPIQSTAAKLGTVLQENFCVINLHGGEPPEGTLQRRVEAAAISDLVIAILEPCTPLRLTPLILSLEILRHYRSVTTPVAVVRQEQIIVSQLNQVDIKPIDRDTIIIVGNESNQFLRYDRLQ
ncbi:MAG: hypothetical protein CV045_03190 [Cyanobacteria bacterium M5B4]|nr:MAG: hypothetical protein CV045_03190 [Cyanobacteria bacterium M5B4]